MKFTWQEFYNRSVKSGCVKSDFTPEVCFNAGQLIEKINALGYAFPKVFSSCLRSKATQIRIYKQKGITDINKIPMNSAHMTGQAVDIIDDGTLQSWLLNNVDKMKKLGLYAESFSASPTWVHLQSVAPKSGRRFFNP